MKRTALTLTASALALLALSACDEATQTTQREPEIRETTQAGDLTVTITANASEIDTVERLTIEITAEAATPTITLTENTIEQFESNEWTIIERASKPAALTADNRYQARYRFVVEPFLEGNYRIPSLTISTSAETSAETSATTDPIAITVRSILEEVPDDPIAALGDPRDPLDAPRPEPNLWPFHFLMLTVAAIGTAAAIFAATRARKTPSTIRTDLARLRALRNTDDPPALSEARRLITRIATAADLIDGEGATAAEVRTIANTSATPRTLNQLADWLENLERNIYRGNQPETRAEIANAVRIAESLAAWGERR